MNLKETLEIVNTFNDGSIQGIYYTYDKDSIWELNVVVDKTHPGFLNTENRFTENYVAGKLKAGGVNVVTFFCDPDTPEMMNHHARLCSIGAWTEPTAIQIGLELANLKTQIDRLQMKIDCCNDLD